MSGLKTVREEEIPDKGPEGLSDGGHVYPACSNCDAILMDIFRTRPHEPETWKIKANCPFCGDASFITEIRGGFHCGGYGILKKDDDSDDIPITTADFDRIDGDTFLFTVRKAKENVKPVTRR